MRELSLFEIAMRDVETIDRYKTDPGLARTLGVFGVHETELGIAVDCLRSGKNISEYVVELYLLDSNKPQYEVEMLAEVVGVNT